MVVTFMANEKNELVAPYPANALILFQRMHDTSDSLMERVVTHILAQGLVYAPHA
jgi:hypothetical protein